MIPLAPGMVNMIGWRQTGKGITIAKGRSRRQAVHPSRKEGEGSQAKLKRVVLWSWFEKGALPRL